MQLNVYTRPPILITSTHDTIPPNGTNVLTASGGLSTSYEWYIGSTNTSLLSTATTYSTNASVNAQNAETVYVLKGSDANCSNTFTKTIYVAVIDPGVIAGDQDVCQGATTVNAFTSTSAASGGTQ